jgi:hypothetical protein
MKTFYKVETFSLGFGLLAGLATGGYDVFILAHPQVPMENLNLDIIYPIFFLLALYGYLFNVKAFVIRSIFFGTTFLMLANLFAYGAVFALVDEALYMPRFAQSFPGATLVNALIEISLARLTWCFMLMLLAILAAALYNRKPKQV